MLPKLQATKPELKTAISMTQIYLYNNDGTQYALLKSLYTDKDDNVVYTIEARPICSLSKASCRCCCTKER